MKRKNESERLALMVRLDQVDALELLAAKTGVPAEDLARRWASARPAARRGSKALARLKGTVPYSTAS